MLQIRKSYPTDAYQLIQIMDTVWKDEFYDVLPNRIFYGMMQSVEKRVQHLKEQIEENNRVYVALEDDKPVGFVFYAKTTNVVYNAAMEIRYIYVLPDFQRKGIGTKLFEHVVDDVERLGISSLIVHCPIPSNSIIFFTKIGAKKKEVISKNMGDYSVMCEVLLFDLGENRQEVSANEWNELYVKAQESLFLLNKLHHEVAVLMAGSGNMYLGLGIRGRVCPIESALSNMYLAGEKVVAKILILDQKSKPVLPCGKCRDLLIELGQEKAEILFDIGTFKTMTMEQLNPYYKKEEKV